MLALAASFVATAAYAQASRGERLTNVRSLIIRSEGEAQVSQHPVPPLPPPLEAKLNQVRALRQTGAFDRIGPLLKDLTAAAPHHPYVVLEKARWLLARGDNAGVVALGRAERQAQHDSVLVTSELEQAYERLGRIRDAAGVVMEQWAVLPTRADWAMAMLVRLLGSDPRGVRDVVRHAVARLPDRIDMARGLGEIEWRTGDANDVLRAIGPLDGSGQRGLRWSLAQEMLRAGTSRDSSMAMDVMLDVVGDARQDAGVRAATSRALWDVFRASGNEAGGAERIARALKDVPTANWNADVLVGVARALRQAGRTADARRLLDDRGSGGAGEPQIALERALSDLRDGPVDNVLPELAKLAPTSPEAQYRQAEALFFAGDMDSAKAVYDRVSKDPRGPYTGAALERMFLIEGANPPAALHVFGEIAYHEWRGDLREATTLADSLYRSLTPGPTWSQAALTLSRLLERGGSFQEALAPVLAVAESQPGDRLAPLARERAGDLYATRLGDDAHAIEQYEEGLARYPRAWNAPEVRRKLEALEKDRRL